MEERGGTQLLHKCRGAPRFSCFFLLTLSSLWFNSRTTLDEIRSSSSTFTSARLFHVPSPLLRSAPLCPLSFIHPQLKEWEGAAGLLMRAGAEWGQRAHSNNKHRKLFPYNRKHSLLTTCCSFTYTQGSTSVGAATEINKGTTAPDTHTHTRSHYCIHSLSPTVAWRAAKQASCCAAVNKVHLPVSERETHQQRCFTEN